MNGPRFEPAAEPGLPADAERTPVALRADAVSELVDAIAGVERVVAGALAVRAELVAAACSAAGVDGGPGSGEFGSSRDLEVRSLRAELAAALRISERSAEQIMATSTGLVNQLPETLNALRQGALSYRHAQIVVDNVSSLADAEPEALRAFETAAVEAAMNLNPPRFERKARELRERLHPESIKERNRRAVEARFVRPEPGRDGMAWLTAYLPAVEVQAIDNRLNAIAEQVLREPGSTSTLHQARADVFRDLLIDAPVDYTACETHGIDVGRFRGIRPTVLITVPVLSLLDQSAEPATLEGYGPIDIDTAKELTAQAPHLRRILTHPETGIVLSFGKDRYQVPADLRAWLRARDETCRFVGCGCAARRCDVDHTKAWFADDGLTNWNNLAHLCRGHHTLKHHTRWEVTQTSDGTLNWTSPIGRTYTSSPARRMAAVASDLVASGQGPPG